MIPALEHATSVLGRRTSTISVGLTKRCEWRAREPTAEELAALRQTVTATLRKDLRVNIRISRQDLEALRRRGAEEGLPYQTLMASVLHKTGRAIGAGRRRVRRARSPSSG